ncbi:restriction endonuclease subunit S [Klebsiella quasipneumoniae]|uniref:restriction endonuclease subunit S n=1 Tax=Klebsiella quasipneumoniae TaxID=1463165 RepID=UPI0021DA7C7E|nr:restriction endonuclease subunit S [Klebsiella quasipneumoniae]MCU8815550.1 restriction endonuclease subunit S [Klebsiella quasipneumoniae]
MRELIYLEKLLDGVEIEWLPIGEIADIYGGLTGKTKADFENGNAKYVSYKNIFSNINIDEPPTDFVNVKNGERQHAVRYGDVLFTGSSETAEEAGISSAITSHFDEPVYLNSFSFGIRFNQKVKIKPEFSKYLFRTNLMRAEIAKTASGVTRFNISKSRFKKVLIPVISPENPEKSLAIQSEIVRILDKFTALTAELTAELTARKKQYNYYRDQLLSFDENEVEWKALGEIAAYSKSRISFDKLDENNYVGVDNLLQNRAGKMQSNYVPTSGNLTEFREGDILIGNIRPYLKKIWQADSTGGTNGDVLVIRSCHESILPRYLYQILADENFFEYNMQHAKGAKMPRGNKDAIMKYRLPIPSLNEQTRIVSVLDKFDTLTNSISEGLPREIELRQKQYEYYRDLLFSFPKPDSVTN